MEHPIPEFQYELVPVRGSDIISTFLKLRAEERGNLTPVLLDSPEKYFLDADAFAGLHEELPDVFAAAGQISIPEFLAQRRAANPELFEELENGEWPAMPHKFDPSLPDDGFIAKVLTPNSFEALAHIGFGGWNDCPTDEEHVAILKWWFERYGAELFAIGGDTIECTVERPPATREDAIVLAREHLAYSPGTLNEFSITPASVPALAAALLNSKHWLFWWD